MAELAYPKSTPPNETNNPITKAGQDLPGMPSGFFNARPMAESI
jgi:hypothetical protein